MNTPAPTLIEAFDTLMLCEVRPERWQLALAATGVDISKPEYQLLTNAAVETYSQTHPGTPLLEALGVVQELGTRAGRDAILQARRARQLTPVHDPDIVGPAEEALALWVSSRTNSIETDVLIIATVIASRKTQQKFFEYLGQAPAALTAKSPKVSQLRSTLEDHFTAHGITGGVQLTCLDWRGEVVIRILHGEHKIVVHEKTAKGTRQHRIVPATNDLVRYNPATGSIAIRSRITMIEPYLNMIGYSVFGDAKFFQDDATINLDPLRRSDALHAIVDTAGILRIAVTRIEFETSNGRTALAGADCHRQAEREGCASALASSRVHKANLSIAFEGTSNRKRCKVQLALPNGLKISDASRIDAVRSVLRRLGILRERGPEGSLGHLDSSQAYAIKAWEQHYGSTLVAAAIDSGILEQNTETTDSSQTPDGLGVIVRVSGLSIETKGIVIVDDSARAPILAPSTSDLLYAISPECVASLIGTAFSIAEKPRLHPNLGAYEIGRRQYVDGSSFRGFFALREISDSAIVTMRQIANGDQLVVWTPHGKNWPALASCTAIGIALLSTPYEELPYQLIQALKWTSTVCPSEWSPPSVPLVIHRAHRRVHWRRTLVQMKTSEDFDRLLMLAEAHGGVVSKDILAANAGSPAPRLISNMKQSLPDELAGEIRSQSGEGYYLTAQPLIV